MTLITPYWHGETGLKKYLTHILGIIGITIGLLGIFLALHFYKKSISKPEPILITDPSRTLIINSEHFSDTTLKIVRSDGNEVVGNVTALRFYFWNNGNKSIKRANILEPIKVSLDDPSAAILDYKILKTSRKVVAPQVTRDINSPENTLSISFEILEEYDGMTGQLIYSGGPETNLIVSGTIEDTKGIMTNTRLIESRYLREFFKGVFKFVLIIVAGAGILVVISFFEKKKPKSETDKKPESKPDENSKQELSKKESKIFYLFFFAIMIALLSFGVWAVYYMIRMELQEAKRQTIVHAIENVPESIMP